MRNRSQASTLRYENRWILLKERGDNVSCFVAGCQNQHPSADVVRERKRQEMRRQMAGLPPTREEPFCTPWASNCANSDRMERVRRIKPVFPSEPAQEIKLLHRQQAPIKRAVGGFRAAEPHTLQTLQKAMQHPEKRISCRQEPLGALPNGFGVRLKYSHRPRVQQARHCVPSKTYWTGAKAISTTGILRSPSYMRHLSWNISVKLRKGIQPCRMCQSFNMSYFALYYRSLW